MGDGNRNVCVFVWVVCVVWVCACAVCVCAWCVKKEI